MDMGEAELLAGPGNDDSRQRWVWSRRSAGPAVSPDPLNLHAPPNLTQVFSSQRGRELSADPREGLAQALPAKLARMAASKLILGVATQFKLRRVNRQRAQAQWPAGRLRFTPRATLEFVSDSRTLYQLGCGHPSQLCWQ
ncbi:hypothetical protein PSTT_11514 [Puccinia striiformis]|uniref:Uncharacterized protein n=2 Tax=Puccinia striiformis TaxID=27350 RepID=A0A0L0V5W6_9BASI|nr:hypothetical protein PSTG_11969 [Puccinia striiformis f. sp. tritici PST-78]POW02871.1 hypothetical protein PSTT_11514 [Puccinia striiformis]